MSDRDSSFCKDCGHEHHGICQAGGDPPSYDICGCSPNMRSSEPQ